MSATDPVRAACLTAPGMGGVAVIQVTGADAPALVGPCLRSKRPLDLEQLPPDQIRLCQIIEGEKILDDVLVCSRRAVNGEWVIELNVHGGPRIVERVLMLLQKRGAKILARAPLATDHSYARNYIEHEALQILPLVQTRSVVEWLLQVKDALPIALDECESILRTGRIDELRKRLGELTSFQQQVVWIIQGARIVVTGWPNAGKSTLVNKLAQREQILVSDIPGTTRDYVEQPAAIEGVPVVFVDTAGIRETQDPLEREAIQRGHGQIKSADLILELMDATSPPDRPPAHSSANSPNVASTKPPRLQVWTKIDQPFHPLAEVKRQACTQPALQISAVTGEGLSALKDAILRALGLTGWHSRTSIAFTSRQHQLLSQASLGLAVQIGPESLALTLLEKCRLGNDSTTDASPSDGL